MTGTAYGQRRAAYTQPGHGGSELADAYLSFLADWGIRPAEEPLQTLKRFTILLSGCETAQRVNEEAITFVVTDLERIWREDKLLPRLRRRSHCLRRRSASRSRSAST